MEKPRQAISGLTPPPWTAHGTWVNAGENGDGPLVADFEYDADAELGAAAPELLAALEEAVDQLLQIYWGEYGHRFTLEDMPNGDNIRAAIAKARGLDNPASSP